MSKVSSKKTEGSVNFISIDELPELVEGDSIIIDGPCIGLGFKNGFKRIRDFADNDVTYDADFRLEFSFDNGLHVTSVNSKTSERYIVCRVSPVIGGKDYDMSTLINGMMIVNALNSFSFVASDTRGEKRLEEEKAGIASDVRDVYAEAKGRGFDVKTMREIVRLRKRDQHERDEQEHLLTLYKSALRMIQTDIEDYINNGESNG